MKFLSFFKIFNQRWFDKNHTLIINKDGNAAVNFEHSWGDGVAVLRFFNEIFDDASKQAFINKNSKPTFNSGDITQVVKKLGFKLNQDQKNNIRLLLVKFFFF